MPVKVKSDSIYGGGVNDEIYKAVLGDNRLMAAKAPKYYDFQFLNVTRLLQLWKQEFESQQQTEPPGLLTPVPAAPAPVVPPLSAEQLKEREQLLAQGFPDWLKKDLINFVKLSEVYGRKYVDKFDSKVEGKTPEQVQQYAKVFFERFEELHNHDKYMKRIERGESIMNKIDTYNQMLQWKTKQYKNPWAEMRFNYGQNKGKQYTLEEDRFIICMAAQTGYGQNTTDWETVRAEIRRAWEFRFDWFFKSRSAAELQRRCDILVRLIEKEYVEEQKKQGVKVNKPNTTGKRKATSQKGPPAKKRRKNEDEDDGDE